MGDDKVGQVPFSFGEFRKAFMGTDQPPATELNGGRQEKRRRGIAALLGPVSSGCRCSGESPRIRPAEPTQDQLGNDIAASDV